uniref:Gamma-glutamyltransferase n=1 Tax=Megaselia scalaris TaxID=36166 RepID=T1GPW7_MEGSC
MIEEGGSAADSIISVLLCEGVVAPHVVGLGGGFMATIYNKEKGTMESLVARETAPAEAHMYMFLNASSVDGALTVGVPGELKGYWELHKKYGKLPWKQLFSPAIQLCKEGIRVTPYMAYAMKTIDESYKYEPSLKDMLIDPKTNDYKIMGDLIFRPVLAKTLEIIADKGADVFYKGEVGRNLVKDLKERGGIITEEDLANYKVKWSDPTKAEFINQYSVYSTPMPGGGAVLTMILNLINEAKNTYKQMTDPKFADLIRPLIRDDKVFDDLKYYGSKSGGPEDHGTSAMSVLHPNGDAISVTSTINFYFGSKIRSPSTGIILNDNLDDFSTPGIVNTDGDLSSPYNFIEPGKRPLSSMCPSIVIDKKGDVKMVLGGAGGTQIVTAISQVLLKSLVFQESLDETINSKRLHHQLLPTLINYEEGFDPEVLEYLVGKGHAIESFGHRSTSAVTAILVGNLTTEVAFDKRRGGSAAIVN